MPFAARHRRPSPPPPGLLFALYTLHASFGPFLKDFSASAGRPPIVGGQAYIGGDFLRALPVRPYLDGERLDPQTLLRNSTYRYIGRGLERPSKLFLNAVEKAVHDVLKNMNITVQLRNWPAVPATTICADDSGTFDSSKRSATQASMLDAYEAVDIELLSFGGEDSVIVQTEHPSPISGFLSTVLSKDGFSVTALPINLSYTTNVMPIVDAMPFESVNIIGTVLEIVGAAVFPVTVQVENVLLIALSEAFGQQDSFIYHRIQSIWTDRTRALARLGIFTYVNDNVSSLYMMGGELLPASLAQAVDAVGIDVSITIVSSKHLGLQEEELLGSAIFAKPIAVPQSSTATAAHGMGLTDAEMIAITLGSITLLVVLLAGIIFCSLKVIAAPPGLPSAPTETIPLERGMSPSILFTTVGIGTGSRQGFHPEKGNQDAISEAVWKIDVEELAICKRSNGQDWVLGTGSFGQVYRGLRGGVQDVALKVVKPGVVPLRVFEKELAVLRHLNLDRNLVQFYGVSHSHETLLLVMEYMGGGDLTSALGHDSQGKLAWKAKGGAILLDVARGLHFLHSNKVAHRDLKGKNILLNHALEAKIGDVGLAAIVGSQAVSSHMAAKGTFAYAAPELLLGGPCDQKVDMFSFGVVCWEVVTHEIPARGDLRPIRVPEEAPREVADLIERCLEREPSARPTAKEAFETLHFLVTTPRIDHPGRRSTDSRDAKRFSAKEPQEQKPSEPQEQRELRETTSIVEAPAVQTATALAAAGSDSMKSIYDTRGTTECDSEAHPDGKCACWATLLDSEGCVFDTAEIDRVAFGAAERP